MLDKIAQNLLNERLLNTCSQKAEEYILKAWHWLLAYPDALISFIPKKIIRNKLKINPERIVFMTNSFNYTCNPKYICEKLLEDTSYEIIWLTDNLKKKRSTFPAGAKLLQYDSMEAFYYVYTARLWISNGVDFSNYFDKKKGQYKIQTMHGSLGIKRLDNAITARNKKGFFGHRVVRRETRDTDLVITNSLFEENVFRSIFWKNTPMKRLGHARTDILFGNDEKALKYIRQRVYEHYGISPDRKLIIFGPTHRIGMTFEDISFDCDRLVAAAEKKFGGKYAILYRLHNRNVKLISNIKQGKTVFNVTEYPDMQELMMISDIAITDYSSWIYDYVVTGKKGFIFAKDQERYNNITGLYYRLEETPFPVASNENELIKNIMEFDEDLYQKKVKAFLDEKEAVDDGHSTERIEKEIVRIIEEGKKHIS